MSKSVRLLVLKLTSGTTVVVRGVMSVEIETGDEATSYASDDGTPEAIAIRQTALADGAFRYDIEDP